MNGNNIFKYATKELSQDAILCYIIAGYNYEDKYHKKIAKKFIERFIFDNENQSEIKNICNIKQQDSNYGNIDISLEIELENNKKYLVLIEDKTDTFLKENQLENEIKQAIYNKDKKAYEIIYILFKTKENYEMQYYYNFKIPFEKLQSEINENDMKRIVSIKTRKEKDFIDALYDVSNDTILKMAKEYYEELNSNKQKDNFLEDLEEKQIERLDIKLKDYGEIKFFRPGGNSKQNYRTAIEINDKIKEFLNYKKLDDNLNELLNKSYWELDIEWLNKMIDIDIRLNICEEDDKYLSFKKLKKIDEKKYIRKSTNRKNLINFINESISEKDKYKKVKCKEDSLIILKYSTNYNKKVDLVTEIVEYVDRVYNELIKLLNKYIEKNRLY